MTERGNKDAIRIGRVDDDGANLPRLAQAEMLPGFAGVDRFVDPVATERSGRCSPSPLPTYRMFGSDGETAIAPIDCVG